MNILDQLIQSFLQQYGVMLAFLIIFLFVVSVWLLSHWSASPGTEVSLFFGLAHYTKRGKEVVISNELSFFRDQVLGDWWSFRDWDRNSLGFVTITPLETTGTVKLIGRAYNVDGERIARWQSIASCINPSEKKIYYYWTGEHPSKYQQSAESFEGFCELTFHGSENHYDSADGIFSDTNLADIERTVYKTFELKRCSDSTMTPEKIIDRTLIGSLIKNKLQQIKTC